ncbi:MAG: ADP-ribosylglycohydrolase family protein, partial [Chthoniobacterales bacterium]|nr:ADP-ribosylglycohydrolase family protein [Chthoniobacterales bacterium]
MTSLPANYLERVYAGILGKIIGVYLGRPVEGWTHERIMGEIGDIRDYVNDRVESAGPIVITDDDISGTFSFIRALEDYPEAGKDLTAEQIGKTWLNYIIEDRAILWWGGLGISTEHTAYLRLKQGIAPPRSGSIELNGRTVAEQIGAQIFVDGWALVAPGDPLLAASLARRAASVSHDGEAVNAATLLAAMEAQAFVERDINKLIDTGLSHIPKESIVRKLIDDLRRWRNKSDDWRAARAQLDVHYGYHKFPGVCPVVPNHGVIMLALLFGNGDFTDSLAIATTAGWDTDCNAGNVGCLLGIRNGLAGIRDRWREPVNDQLFLPTADGGACLTDALTQAVRIANLGRRLASNGTGVSPVPSQSLTHGRDAHATKTPSTPSPVSPKDGARFHFSMPGARQGFTIAPVTATLSHESNRLRAIFRGAARVSIDTFITPEQAQATSYSLIVSPTLYAGQILRAKVIAAPGASCAARFDIGTYYGDAIARRMG